MFHLPYSTFGHSIACMCHFISFLFFFFPLYRQLFCTSEKQRINNIQKFWIVFFFFFSVLTDFHNLAQVHEERAFQQTHFSNQHLYFMTRYQKSYSIRNSQLVQKYLINTKVIILSPVVHYNLSRYPMWQKTDRYQKCSIYMVKVKTLAVLTITTCIPELLKKRQKQKSV